MTQPLPWQHDIWRRLTARRVAKQLPHALLLRGPAGVGRRQFAEALAQTLLCAHPRDDGTACGACGECALFIAQTHPDVMRIGLLEDKREIGIDQIRELRDFVTLRGHQGRYRVIIIDPAERLNTSSANALLKTLEEPGQDTLLMLIASRSGALPATVRSRCQTLEFPVPPVADALRWLQSQNAGGGDANRLLELAGGAPLRALAFAGNDAVNESDAVGRDLCDVATGKADPVTVADRWAKAGSPDTLGWVQNFIATLIRLKFNMASSIKTSDTAASGLQPLLERMDARELFTVSDLVAEAQRDTSGTLNRTMVLENVLITWNERFARAGRRIDR